jgi:hypothetical protein
LRALSISMLYRLQVLARAYALDFPNPETRQLAGQLLPPQVRQRLR